MKKMSALAIIAAALVLGACATIKGAKEDAKSIGDTLSNAVN